MGTIQELKAFLKLKKNECSSFQKALILRRLKDFNEKFRTSHWITWEQVGQADLYTWKIVEKWNKPPKQPPGTSLQLRLF